MPLQNNPEISLEIDDLDIGSVNLQNIADTIIDPSTEGKQDALIAHYGTIGDAADANGTIHGQLLYIGEQVVQPAEAEHTSGSVFASAHATMSFSGVRKDTRAALAGVDDGDYTPFQTTANGDVRVRDDDLISLLGGGVSAPTVDSYTSAVINIPAGATTAVISTPGANKQIWIYGLTAAADTAAGIVTLVDEDSTAFSGAMAVSDEGHIPALQPSGNLAMPHIKLTTNKGFSITTVGCTLDGLVTYAVVDVS